MRLLMILVVWALFTGSLVLLKVDGAYAGRVSLIATLVLALLTAILSGVLLIVRDTARALFCPNAPDR